MTATAITTWRIIVENRGGHDGAGTGGHYGSWKKVWASRENIADVQVVEEKESYRPGRISTHHNYKEIEITLTDKFDPDKDYLLIEHKRSPNPHLRGSSYQERYELLAGTMPAWANFPQAWQDWVNNPEVQRYAEAHICSKCPEVKDLVDYARAKTAKGRIIRAWNDVAWTCGVRDDIEGNGSWTAVTAMPIRIAQKLGGFRPPVQRPVWGKRNEGVNAFLVASPEFE